MPFHPPIGIRYTPGQSLPVASVPTAESNPGIEQLVMEQRARAPELFLSKTAIALAVAGGGTLLALLLRGMKSK